MKEDINEMNYEIERLTFENKELSRKLYFATVTTATTTTTTTTTATTTTDPKTTPTPTTQPHFISLEKLQIFVSSEELNWFEANRVTLQFFLIR